MEYKQIIQAYFSPCGTTQKAVCSVGQAWGCVSKKEIDMTPFALAEQSYTMTEQEILIVGVPAFGGRVPETAVKRLQKLHGNHTPAIAVVTFGNRAFDDTLLELQDILQKQGFVVVAGIGAVTEHSIMHCFGKDRPTTEDCKQLCAFGEQIKTKMEKSIQSTTKIPGNRPYITYHSTGLVPVCDDACKGCGICADNCPTEAIPKEKPNTTDKQKCISCMGCIAICPEKARSIPAPVLDMLIERLGAACSTRKENTLYL